MINLKRMFQIQTMYTAFEPIYPPDFQFVGERHNFWELVYCVEGCAGILEEDKIYELSPGDIIFHKPMEFHRLWAEKNTEIHLIVMSFSIIGTGVDFLGKGVFHLNEKNRTDLKNILGTACYCKEFEDEIKNQLISNTLERLIIDIIVEHSAVKGKKRTIGDNNYKNIIRVMNDNLRNKLTIDELAELCNLSTSNLKKTFKKYSGMGVIDYFNQLKITEAVKMLEDDIPINEISETLGFSSPGYFCDVFRKKRGTTPSVYRKEYKYSGYYYTKQQN